MDSFSEKQLAAMEKSGGNQKLIDYFESRNVKKSLPVHVKYNTKQAEYLRNRLARWLEGRTEPPPDPGNYDPVTGVSDAQGAEALAGETTEEYNQRQARLRDAARERMRAKFGDGGMGGIGAGGSVDYSGMGGGGGGGGGGGDGLTDKIGGALGGLGSFFKEKVIDNERLRGAVGGVVSKTGQVAGGAYNSLKESERFGGAVGAVGGIVGKAGEKLGVSGQSGGAALPPGRNHAQVEKDFWDRMYQKPGQPEATSPAKTDSFGSAGQINKAVSAPIMTTKSSNGKVGGAKAMKATDDDWGGWGDDFGSPPETLQRAKTSIDPPKEATPEPQPQKSMSFGASPAKSESNGSNGYTAASPAPAPAAKKPELASDLMKKPSMTGIAPTPKKAAPAKLSSADDFFADFGM